jgi:predicted nuclease of predicted toxin-antitoxin system
VKLLFDENVSPRLVAALMNEYPGSAHFRDVGLRGVADARIWSYAHAQGFAIVSKDTDFRERSFLEGAPPKVVWLDVGNATTSAIIELLQREQSRVLAFGAQPESSVLILSIGPGAV